MSQGSVVFKDLSSVFLNKREKEREKKKKERNGHGTFSQGRHSLLAGPHWDFPSC
jgi:hypothetical protein